MATKTSIAIIGPGLYVRSGRKMDKFEREWEAIRRRERACEHLKRDPRGTCYRCGHQEVK
jgi:hypothetical protein